MDYYKVMVFMVIGIMVTSLIHLLENDTLSRRIIKELGVIAALISVGMVCEFYGTTLNGKECSKILHGTIKAIEFTIAPIIPICYIRIVAFTNFERLKKLALGIIVTNGMLEFVSIFMPIVFYIDKDYVYRRGIGYPVYRIAYFMGIVLFIFELLKVKRKYQSRNIATLFAMVVFLIAGLAIRLINNNLHTDWLIVAIVYLFFIIDYSDIRLKVDPLTDLLNRKSFENKRNSTDYATAVILLDINDFKSVNDTGGHERGDEILQVIASLIKQVYGKYGYCYRIGGDEFCVILKSDVLWSFGEKITQQKRELVAINKILDKVLDEHSKEYPELANGMSKGCGIIRDENDTSVQEEGYKLLTTVNQAYVFADKQMYKEKEQFKLHHKRE